MANLLEMKIPVFSPKLKKTFHMAVKSGKYLRKIKADTQISLNGKKLLTVKIIEKLVKRAKFSIYEHAKSERNIRLLREDLANGILQVFEDHSKCRDGICNDVGRQINS